LVYRTYVVGTIPGGPVFAAKDQEPNKVRKGVGQCGAKT
jgi:hypothetical protein